VAAFVLAVLVHPGALALGPGLLLLGGVELGSKRARRGVAWAVGLSAGAVLLLGADWWTGGRGVLHATPDQTFARGLQDAWRLLSRDVGAAALPVLVGGLVAWESRQRRPLMGLGLIVLGASASLARWSDNPGHLPTLFAAAVFAPQALYVGFAPTRVGRRLSRSWATLVVLVVALGITEGLSREDARARGADSRFEALSTDCAPRDEPFRSERLRALACRGE
jgi:hypothetical protein